MESKRVWATVAVAVLGLPLLLSGCAVIEGPTPETPTREVAPVPESAPVLVPGGTAEDNLPFFTEVLRGYAATDQPVKGEPIARAVIDAGFDKTAMQFSYDRTETGLDADNIFVSVRIGADCLVGQIVAGDRSFVAKNMPAVGPEANICLIGETRTVDW